MKWLGPAPFVAFSEYACVSNKVVWDFTRSFLAVGPLWAVNPFATVEAML